MQGWKVRSAALALCFWTASVTSQSFSGAGGRGRFPETCAASPVSEAVAQWPQEARASTGRTCVFERSDGAEALFYVIEADTGFVDSIAKVSPLAASALLNFVAYDGFAPPIDMVGGQIGFERMPTRDSVAAKAVRNWPRANAMQLELGTDTGALVEYRSSRLESGEIALVLSPSLVDATGVRLKPLLPEIEVRLVATGRSPVGVQNIPDRSAPVFAIARYEVISR